MDFCGKFCVIIGVKINMEGSRVGGNDKALPLLLSAIRSDLSLVRYMSASPGEYRGALHCARVTLSAGGPRAFYRGFVASCLRLVSWNVVLWLTYEQIKLLRPH